MRLADLAAFVNRLIALLRRSRLERDLDDELAFHLAMRDDEQARQDGAFGNVLRVKEQARDAWLFAPLEAVLHDVRFACRSWRRSPGFALVAMSTLACGIAVANTTFAIVNGALIRRLPFANPERLVHLGFKPPRADYGSVSFTEYRDLQSVRSLRLAAYTAASLTIAEEGRVLSGSRASMFRRMVSNCYGLSRLRAEAFWSKTMTRERRLSP